jgi:hypothetical protein
VGEPFQSALNQPRETDRRVRFCPRIDAQRRDGRRSRKRAARKIAFPMSAFVSLPQQCFARRL